MRLRLCLDEAALPRFLQPTQLQSSRVRLCKFSSSLQARSSPFWAVGRATELLCVAHSRCVTLSKVISFLELCCKEFLAAEVDFGEAPGAAPSPV